MGSYECPDCDAKFTRKANRDRHYKNVHSFEKMVHQCTICGNVFDDVPSLQEHRLTHEQPGVFVKIKTAFRGTCVIYRKTYSEKMKTLEMSFQNDREDISDVLTHELSLKRVVKAALVFQPVFIRPREDGTLILYPMLIRTHTRQVNSTLDIDSFLTGARQYSQNRIDDMLENGSGWILDSIGFTDICLGSCSPLNGACNLLSVKYLTSLQKLRLIEPTRETNRCFLDAVAYHFTRRSEIEVLTKWSRDNLKVCEDDLPMKISQLSRFEQDHSELDLAINVLYAEGKDIFPLRVTKLRKAKNSINLLLFKTVLENRVVSHFCYIEDLDKLLRRSYRGNGGKIGYEKSFRCLNCLLKFGTEQLKNEHMLSCEENKPQRVIVPDEGDTVSFRNYAKKTVLPYIGCFDFEAVLEKPDFKCGECKNDKTCAHKTTVESLQTPTTYSLIIMETDTSRLVHKKTYSGTDAAENLLNELLDIEQTLIGLMNRYPNHNLTKSEEKEFLASTLCHICEAELGEDKCRDHSHATGKYLGSAHSLCNIQRHSQTKIVLFCHNLAKYDSHFIISALSKSSDKRIKKVEALPYNTEHFRTVSINSYDLLDSMSFLSASLAVLVDSLPKDHKYSLMDQMGFYDKNTEQYKKRLLLRKGVYPYEFVTSLEQLENMTEIPPLECFYSSLTNSTISPEDHKHAKLVFKVFGCGNMLDYTKLYCETDVVLLLCVICEFRRVIFEVFHLDCW